MAVSSPPQPRRARRYASSQLELLGQREKDRGVRALPVDLAVRRSDPIYNAHAYLTKVPYSAIIPFIEALTEPGDVVLDVFAGSGMTGVAAVIAGRRAELRDISVLGRHIGRGYLSQPSAHAVRIATEAVVAQALEMVGDVYAASCGHCRAWAILSKTVWSFIYVCDGCGGQITYYEAFRAAGWRKSAMRCGHCAAVFAPRRAERVGEIAVLDSIRCGCSLTIRDQPHVPPSVTARLDGLAVPDVAIDEDRQMFQASALAKHGMRTTASFFSQRNLAVLAALRHGIGQIEDPAVRHKLLFAFTAVLTRASKRYQWHPKRPLNAANQNYYIAPVFYEWNVYELFERKVTASLRADEFLVHEMAKRGVPERPRAQYRLGSADALDLPDASVDYVFTDPPFGSQIFYSDMNLFQEAWLGEFTDASREAVVDRSGPRGTRRSAERYEHLIVGALRECSRVLRDDGWLSMVFSNSRGGMWLLVQRAIGAAGFVLEHVTRLDKGQRSVKGLASGLESVVTADLILTMRKATGDQVAALQEPPASALERALRGALAQPGDLTPTKVYLWVITEYLRNAWKLDGVTVSGIRATLEDRGFDIDPATGALSET